MPASFEHFVGLSDDQLRAARRDHDVHLTGASLALCVMVPSLSSSPGPGGATVVLLRDFFWLMLSACRPGADIQRTTRLAPYLVHPSRCGVALDACIAAGMDTSPAKSASVARARIASFAANLFRSEPAAFLVSMADLYVVTLRLPPPPLALVVGLAGPVPAPPLPQAHPPAADLAELRWFVDDLGTFAPLSFAESIICPRIFPEERKPAAGWDFLLGPAAAHALKHLPVLMQPQMDQSELALLTVQHVLSCMPVPMLANLLPNTQARMALLATLPLEARGGRAHRPQ